MLHPMTIELTLHYTHTNTRVTPSAIKQTRSIIEQTRQFVMSFVRGTASRSDFCCRGMSQRALPRI